MPRQPNINQVALSGRVVEKPHFDIDDHNTPYIASRIMTKRVFRNEDDQWDQTHTCFDFILTDKAAETLKDQLATNQFIFITGRLENLPENESACIMVRNLQILQD